MGHGLGPVLVHAALDELELHPQVERRVPDGPGPVRVSVEEKRLESTGVAAPVSAVDRGERLRRGGGGSLRLEGVEGVKERDRVKI